MGPEFEGTYVVLAATEYGDRPPTLMDAVEKDVLRPSNLVCKSS